jgi:hypothetical protein
MKTPEQLKGAIRNIAANHHLRAQKVMQIFLFERIFGAAGSLALSGFSKAGCSFRR